MSSNETLLRQLLQAAQTMIQGGLSETTRQCGKPTCVCQLDPARRHGPHLYLTFRKDGKSRSLYVAPEHAPAVHQARAAWARFWELGCTLADRNRTAMQAEWQQPVHAPMPRKSTLGRKGRS
jgi:hypothetical protein